MKITIIYDNTAYQKELKTDWGFSAKVETAGRKILFDTGANGSILFSNMETLGISPDEFDDVFISHSHWDHTGGLSDFLQKNSEVTVFIPEHFKVREDAKEVTEVVNPEELYDGIYSTGTLEKIEQSLCVETEKGIVVILGCSHPRMNNILDTASGFGEVYGIIGGLHGTHPKSLKGLELICPTHCTQHIEEIKELYPDAYIEGGAGRVIEI